jgi:hypothetical protein
LERSGWADYVFAFHDNDEIGPRMLARICKQTGLKADDLSPSFVTATASGGIRNHEPEAMIKAFGIAGLGPEVVEARFGGMYRAFQ